VGNRTVCRCKLQILKYLRLYGGPDRDRTDDLFHAMEARSQLRHRPTKEGTNSPIVSAGVRFVKPRLVLKLRASEANPAWCGTFCEEPVSKQVKANLPSEQTVVTGPVAKRELIAVRWEDQV
jgi:hypothetical protein